MRCWAILNLEMLCREIYYTILDVTTTAPHVWVGNLNRFLFLPNDRFTLFFTSTANPPHDADSGRILKHLQLEDMKFMEDMKDIVYFLCFLFTSAADLGEAFPNSFLLLVNLRRDKGKEMSPLRENLHENKSCQPQRHSNAFEAFGLSKTSNFRHICR